MIYLGFNNGPSDVPLTPLTSQNSAFKKIGLSDISVLALFAGLSDIGLCSIGLSDKNRWSK